MALNKGIPTNFGVDATYWRVLGVQFNMDDGCQVVMAGYINAAARQSGANPAATMTIDMNGEDRPVTKDGVTLAAIYGKVKALTQFEGAEDVLEKS